jgi:hypothetical protein
MQQLEVVAPGYHAAVSHTSMAVSHVWMAMQMLSLSAAMAKLTPRMRMHA